MPPGICGLHPGAIWLFVDGITRRLDLIGGLGLRNRSRIGGSRLFGVVFIQSHLWPFRGGGWEDGTKPTTTWKG
jgi:hypothetical protein